MSTQQPEVREDFTVHRTPRNAGAIPLFLITLVLFVAGILIMGSAASKGEDGGTGSAFLFFAGIVVTTAAFWLPMTFHKR
ncbi:hypothetical protein [Luteimicrobium subarcticum]|uniref:Uncharacterized protein n=1 Tax=Luteimicrobium subarcticum TaxID=620910 RepID=A0A2M8WJA7_9MICO|nr:hypothetical protein [Luteimicrobium subarcticum]PJI91009.1 hypothetical protein CLV34_2268 [Luteimicrobium subarcticum]